MKPIDFVLGQAWAMLPEMVETLVSIADRTNLDPEAVAAKLGRPLDNTQKVTMRGSVAVIPIRGPISRYASMFNEISGATSVDVLARDFTASLGDPAVRGIVLEIDSPGGQAAGIGELAAMIRAGSKKKPVHAYVSSMGASAALWLAAGAGKVIVSPSALMGSMGVVWPVPLPRNDGKGPREIEFVSSQSPNKRPDVQTDAGKAEMQRIVDQMAQVFVDAVASYRGLDPETAVESFGRGGLLIGRDAVNAGMADRLGTLESAIEGLNNTEDSLMKINFPRAITAWLSKGTPEVMEVAPETDANAETETEQDRVASTNLGEFTAEFKVDTAEMDAEIARVKAELEAGKADLRKTRLALFGDMAKAFLSLHGDKFVPAERDILVKGYVGAAMMDAESPAEEYSYLDFFKASIDARAAHSLGGEAIRGDAKDVADKLNAKGLKVLPNARATEEEIAAEQEQDARIRAMLEATETGRAYLASRAK